MPVCYEYLPEGIANHLILRKFHISRNMGKRILFILVVFVFSVTVSSGQNEKKLDSLISTADSLSRSKNFTAALEVNLSAVDLLKKLKENSYFQAMSPIVMLNTGTCYRELGDVNNAHRFMTYSLQLARANKVHLDIELAFISLNSLHKHISISNLSFDYPVVPATEELGMFYVISKIEKVSADSVRIIIQGGKYDGIDDSVKKGGIISRYDANKKNEKDVVSIPLILQAAKIAEEIIPSTPYNP